MSLVLAGLALGAGGLAARGASKSNKRRPGVPEFQPYSGHKPPLPNYTRDTEKLIYETLARRSQGEDVGFDPRRREALLENYEIENDRYLDRQTDDIQNALSGMGLSKNLRAYDALMLRALEDNKRDKDLYTNRVDIEDLSRANEERDINTARLQDFNNFNFGQENTRAGFDLDVYNSENNQKNANYSQKVQRANNYQDPLGAFVQGGLSTYGALSSGGSSGGLSVGGGGTPYVPDPSETFRKSMNYYSPSGTGYSGGRYQPTTSYRLGGR